MTDSDPPPSFLLERTRVARVNKEERNFHIFYQLLAGLQPEQLSAYHLGDEKTFHYLSQSGCYTFNGANDREKFKQTMKVRRRPVIPSHKLLFVEYFF